MTGTRAKAQKRCRFCGHGPHYTPADMCEGMYGALLNAFRAAAELERVKRTSRTRSAA